MLHSVKLYLAVAFSTLIFVTSFSTNAALLSRLGGQALYDTDLNVTWLANANLAVSNTFGVGGINIDGTMNWSTANSWINAMNADSGTGYLGYNDQRLPTTTQPDASCSNQFDPGEGFAVQGSGSGCLASEMGHLNNIEGVFWDVPPAPGNPFSNLQFNAYWSGTEYAPDTSGAWSYSFDLGGQGIFVKSNPDNYAWAVRSGVVVPVPAAVWLFGSGLLGLIGLARRKART